MTAFKFKTIERAPGTLGMWIRINATEHRCGNVSVRLVDCDEAYSPRWFIFLKTKSGKWRKYLPKTRTYGYGHPSQAKIGAVMAARWARGKKKAKAVA